MAWSRARVRERPGSLGAPDCALPACKRQPTTAWAAIWMAFSLHRAKGRPTIGWPSIAARPYARPWPDCGGPIATALMADSGRPASGKLLRAASWPPGTPVAPGGRGGLRVSGLVIAPPVVSARQLGRGRSPQWAAPQRGDVARAHSARLGSEAEPQASSEAPAESAAAGSWQVVGSWRARTRIQLGAADSSHQCCEWSLQSHHLGDESAPGPVSTCSLRSATGSARASSHRRDGRHKRFKAHVA